jgi:hypothetical protein
MSNDSLLELSAQHLDFGEVNYAPNAKSKTCQLYLVNHSKLSLKVNLLFQEAKQSNELISIELINPQETTCLFLDPGASIPLDFQICCADFVSYEHPRTSFFKVSNRCSLEVTSTKEFHICTDIINSKLDFIYSALLCTSVMHIENLELDFQDCVESETYMQEFIIWNRSESYLQCVIHFDGDTSGNVLQLVDMDSLQLILCGSTVTIPSFAPKRVGVQFLAEVDILNFLIICLFNNILQYLDNFCFECYCESVQSS